MSKKYNNESIKSLRGAERVRSIPGVIFGAGDETGAMHSFFEILSNSVDEAKGGHGDVIETIVHKDNSFTVIDKGRGIPMDFNGPEERYNWDLLYNELYAGGKYDPENIDYADSLGIHGLGAASTQYASEFFEVQSYRDGYKYSASFRKGVPIMSNGKPLPEKHTKKQYDSVLRKEKTNRKETGTTQNWKPDSEVFTSIKIDLEELKEMINIQAIINDGIKFILNIEEEDKVYEYLYPEGIFGYVKEISTDKGISSSYKIEMEGRGKDNDKRDEYSMRATVAFAFNNDVNLIKYFHNSSPLENGGSPDRAVKSAFVYAFDQELNRKKMYNAKESKITFNDISESLIVMVNSFSTWTSYANQTKKAINNKFIQTYMNEVLRKELNVWIIENKVEAERVLGQILANKRSRETAEKNRVNYRKKLMAKTDTLSNNIKKFVDCRSNDASKTELFIAEGDSAVTSIKSGRDAEYQAIMPVRGKILNTLKASYSKIFSSEIIVNLIQIMGCGVELKTKSKKMDTFNLDNLKWDKIIICTDADVDGFQIRTLILSMLYKLTPTLINEGYVYIAETPLYEITFKERGGKEVIKFAFDEQEKDEIIKGKKNYTLQRSKGLGENDPQMMWDTTLNPETRRLIRVQPEDAKEMDEWFELFLGNNLVGRKEYIAKNGHLYMDDIDID